MQNQQTAQQQGALGTYNAAYQAAIAQPGAALAKVLAIDPIGRETDPGSSQRRCGCRRRHGASLGERSGQSGIPVHRA